MLPPVGFKYKFNKRPNILHLHIIFIKQQGSDLCPMLLVLCRFNWSQVCSFISVAIGDLVCTCLVLPVSVFTLCLCLSVGHSSSISDPLGFCAETQHVFFAGYCSDHSFQRPFICTLPLVLWWMWGSFRDRIQRSSMMTSSCPLMDRLAMRLSQGNGSLTWVILVI